MTQSFAPGRWHARWIWTGRPKVRAAGAIGGGVDPDAFDRFALFRRSFDVGHVPTIAPLRVTADSRYVLYLNGEEISRGPVRGNPRRLRYDVVDIASRLTVGRNALAAVVRFYGRATPWWMPAPATFSLGAGSFVLEAQIGDELVVTDASWRALDGAAWNRVDPPAGIGTGVSEWFDARAHPSGWTGTAFDDESWTDATELMSISVGASGRHEPPSDPYGPMLPRPIPQLVGEEREARAVATSAVRAAQLVDDPVLQVEADERGATAAGETDAVTLITYDFGEVVAGTVRLEIEAAAGTRIDASGAETLRDDGSLRRLNQHSGFRYVARGEDDRFETFEAIGTRYLKLAVRNPDGRATIERVSVKERLYPRADGPFFACSDPLLDRVYDIGLRTVDICAQDAYLDCPTREQRAWTGDSVVHQQVHLASSPDWGLARWHPQMAASPRPDGMLPMAAAGEMELADTAYIPDWALHWVRAVHNLYRYTGDRDLVSSLLPVAENVLRWFAPFRAPDGLLHDVTGWVLIDWASVYSYGCSGALNALWARGLRDLGEMASWLGDERALRWTKSMWDGVAEGFAAFWDDERNCYVDHIVDGHRQEPVSEHVGASALCAGIVPVERVPYVVDLLTDRSRHIRHSWAMMALAREDPGGMSVLVRGYPAPEWDARSKVVAAEPFFRYVVHDALATSGHADLIGDACRDWKVFVDAGSTTWPETWHGGTHCHGWSSTPTRDLVVYVLGVTPQEPGFARARVAPRLGDLEFARGAAPTPLGLLRVDATHDVVSISSPVPVTLDLADGEERILDAGDHEVKR